MKVLRTMFITLFCVVMVFAMPITAFAAEPFTEEVNQYKANENVGDELELRQGASYGAMELTLNPYVGLTKNFFVLAQGKDINDDVEIQLRLLDSESNIWGEWTIGGNEYSMWTLNLPPSGTWTLMVSALNLGPTDVVSVFARWQ